MACPMCGARWNELAERLGCEIDPELDGRLLPVIEAIADWLDHMGGWDETPGDGEPAETPEGEQVIELSDHVRPVG